MFSSGTGLPGQSRTKGRKTVVVVVVENVNIRYGDSVSDTVEDSNIFSLIR